VTPPLPAITADQFFAVDIRIGTVVSADAFPEARKPAYKLVVDFGPEIGRKTSSVQITQHYAPSQLVGRQVCGVVNLPPRRIGPFVSEVLTLGFADKDGYVVLINADQQVPNGARLH
jgi:tRNA-binding protein